MPRPRHRTLHAAAPVVGVALASLALGSPAAVAQGCTGQAGTSALEQYCEAIPRGDGGRDRPSSKPGNGSGVNRSTSAALRSAGADGAAVAALAGGASGASSSSGSGGGASSKTSTTSKSKPSSSTGGAGNSASAGAQGGTGAVKGVSVQGPKDPSSNPLAAATKAAESGPVAGPALVWTIVALSGAGAIAAVVLRRRESLAPPGSDDDTNAA